MSFTAVSIRGKTSLNPLSSKRPTVSIATVSMGALRSTDLMGTEITESEYNSWNINLQRDEWMTRRPIRPRLNDTDCPSAQGDLMTSCSSRFRDVWESWDSDFSYLDFSRTLSTHVIVKALPHLSAILHIHHNEWLPGNHLENVKRLIDTSAFLINVYVLVVIC